MPTTREGQQQVLDHSSYYFPSPEAITGSVVGFLSLFFAVVWWVRGLAERVSQNEQEIKEFSHSLKNDREELKVVLKKEINSTATDICHGFELFAQEMRQQIRIINDRLEIEGKISDRAKSQSDYLDRELRALVTQLSTKGIDVHLRDQKEGYDS